MKRSAVIFPWLVHNQEVSPVETKNTFYPLSDAVPRQDIHATLPVQGVISFSDVKENLVEEILHHHCHMLDNIDFEGGIPHSYICPEIVQRIVKIHHRLYPSIYHYRHRLPNDLHNPDTMELPVTLRGEDYRLPCTLQGNPPLCERGLDNIHHLVPLICVRTLLPSFLHQVLLKIL